MAKIKDREAHHPKQSLRMETVMPGNGREKTEVGEWWELVNTGASVCH